MNTELLNYFVNDGVWAILSAVLIFYILKQQEKRDAKQDERDTQYQTIITNLSTALKDMNDIKILLENKLKG